VILRRNGSIDFRVLAGRLASYGAVALIALAVGVLVASVGS
jgi:hypothetical protein